MNDLLKINYDREQPTVSARELYKELEVKYDFKRWVDSNFKDFIENTDYFASHIDVNSNQYGGKKEVIDYDLTIDMGKHLSLMSHTSKGMVCRQYLIDLDKAWNTPEQVMARALKMADQTINKLKTENTRLSKEVNIKNQLIGELKPKADYTDTILKSKDLVTITQISKDYGMSGQEMNKLLNDLGVQYKESGQWLLYRDYQGKGYTMSETVTITHSNGMPGTKMHTKWTQKGRLFLYQLLKKHGCIPLIEQDRAS